MTQQTELPGTEAPTRCREQRTCKSCKGTKTYTIGGYRRDDGTHVPETTYPCHCCTGRGLFDEVDVPAILKDIAGRKGLRSQRPDSARAYYVWRMARFHGGADVTMPMVATSGVRGDPFLPELDQLADAVAKRVFGTHMAAAHRWGRLLTNDMPYVRGLPPTAYETGPVLDGVEKPECEIAELARC